jgi:hypothetical protein
VEFIDYICGLAGEGETALFVRQKPQLKDGAIQFHADGAIVATWPAYYPDKHKIKAGQAWYGNTGIFKIDRFKNEYPSASKSNIEYVLCLMLDDIGTKSKTPPLKPTWIIESSANNFQWVYVFNEQPTKAAYVAAYGAIADAGYTDPGASNPVRNFRLPGSVNLKPSANGFVSRLVEFNPECEYTLDDICSALGVVPHMEQGDGARSITLADDGNDDVMRWLSEKGMVLTKPNSLGWTGVICPNSAQHSDGNPEGRYLPANRAYCCYHGHCQGLNSQTFLDWVAENGGPKHVPGLREELLTQAMDQALAKLTPTDMFKDNAAAVIADAERKELGRVERSEWWERFAYIQEDDAYFDMQDRRELARGTFNALFRHIGCKSIHSGRKIEASYSFDENRQTKGAKSLVGITYAAGAGGLVVRDGHVYGNRWRNARPTPVAGDVAMWLTHVERMVPERFEREHLLNALAHKVQFPGHKINHAILMGGNHGSGKDTLFAPFFWAIGGESKHNCSLVKNEDLNSQWGYALECEVMEIAELRQAEAKDRRALENTLKPIIAAPPELLSVNRKGLHPYMALNRVFVIAFSNERVAISLPSEDRRWFVLWADVPKLPEAQATGLWNWYQRQGGFEAVASYLHDRDVSAWNPNAPPPMTEAKAIMVEHGMSTAESFLVDLMRRRVGEFSRGAIGAPFHGLCDRLQGQAPAGTKIVQAALLHALKEAGWIDLGRIKSRDYDTRKHVFCAADMAGASKSDLRRMVEAT